MASNITLSAGVRQNLLSLQNTANLMSMTQNRLATGKKVNSALDNPTNFFTSASLRGRASDMGALLDAMSNGIKTLEAADNGLSAITKTVESMQSTLRQARQDKSFKSASYDINLGANPAGTEELSFAGGSVGTTAVDIALTTGAAGTASTITAGAYTDIDVSDNAADEFTFDITLGTDTVSITLDQSGNHGGDNIYSLAEAQAEIQSQLDAFNAGAGLGVTVGTSGGALTFTADVAGATALTIDNGAVSGANLAITDLGITDLATTGQTNTGTAGTLAAKSVDTLVAEINGHTDLADKVRASNDNGKLRIENLSTAALTLTGVTAAGVIDGGATNGTIGGNDVRKNLVKQFNELRDQLNKLADDASFNGVNLLRGDKLKITFNETGTSTMEIQAKEPDGDPTSINASTLSIAFAVDADFDSDTTLDSRLETLQNALNTLRSQSSSFGSNLSIVQNRQSFTKAMINTLETGADNLVLADSNEEGANLLALQTRQQLSTTALSLSAQADQAVLRLF